MGDCMKFPDTVEEFMEQYKVTDYKQVYTNGTELVPIFRMKQWFEHQLSADVVQVVHGEWEYIDDTYCGFEDTDVRCSVCKTITNIKRFRKTKWCPDCGALMDGERREE